jgi:hypothetical protein
MPAWLLLVVALSACGWQRRVKLLDDQEFDHYYALRVWMDDAQRKAYLKRETREERDAYLKELGLWDRFYKYEPHVRTLIVQGEVKVGWTKDMLYMAWGEPFDRQKLPGRKAERSELLVYRFEQQPDGSVLVWTQKSATEYKAVRLFMREVTLDDDVVTEMQEKEKSW